MPFVRHSRTFDGAYLSPDDLQPQEGVYVVWDNFGETWRCLEVGEAQDVREALKNHPRSELWEARKKGTVYYSATYTPGLSEIARRELERSIRLLEHPLYGKRIRD